MEVTRKNSDARIVLGGPGFNYYARDWLDYLDVDYGIRGEGEVSFPLYLKRLAEGGDIYSAPGCVSMRDGNFHAVSSGLVDDLDRAALPAYDLFDLEKYAERNITPAIFTKRGCAFACTFCPYSKLEGKRYRLKSPERVLAEIHHVLRHTAGRRVMFCDNSFNVPRRHAEALCRASIADQLDFGWGTGDLKPIGVTDEFCRLLEASGCFYVNLAIESASETMLQRMKRGYTVRQVRQSLDALSRSRFPLAPLCFSVLPAKHPKLSETLQIFWTTITSPTAFGIPTLGAYLWTDYQDVVGEARRSGHLRDNRSCSPAWSTFRRTCRSPTLSNCWWRCGQDPVSRFSSTSQTRMDALNEVNMIGDETPEMDQEARL